MLSKNKLDIVVSTNTMLNKRKLDYLSECISSISKNKIEGDVVECGVWMGGSVALLANVLLTHNNIRTFRLFESFDDPHEPLPIDGNYLINLLGGNERSKGRLTPIKGFYKKVTKGKGPGNAKHVYNLLTKIIGYPGNKIKIYKGWVQNTLLPYSKRIDKVSLLIIDCDLYIPTKLCLEYLYPKVVKNGIIFIDDYPTLDGCKKAVDDYLKNNNIDIKITQVPTTGSIYLLKK
jgi:hypothetical protein